MALHGIKQLRVFARQIIASRGSQLDVSTPDWNQEFARRVVFGVDGIDGKHGFDGPIGETNKTDFSIRIELHCTALLFSQQGLPLHVVLAFTMLNMAW